MTKQHHPKKSELRKPLTDIMGQNNNFFYGEMLKRNTNFTELKYLLQA